MLIAVGLVLLPDLLSRAREERKCQVTISASSHWVDASSCVGSSTLYQVAVPWGLLHIVSLGSDILHQATVPPHKDALPHCTQTRVPCSRPPPCPVHVCPSHPAGALILLTGLPLTSLLPNVDPPQPEALTRSSSLTWNIVTLQLLDRLTVSHLPFLSHLC